MHKQIRTNMQTQPDDTTCGPTCLHAVYQFYDYPISLQRVIDEVDLLEEGGTFAVSLANHALKCGFAATIYTYNLQMFDPTWFGNSGVDIPEKLRAQLKAKNDRKLRLASQAYLKFFERGGELLYQEISPSLIRSLLNKGKPILTGLSATYLYGCAREHNDDYDDVLGTPMGHFVALAGYQPEGRQVLIADPIQDNPKFRSRYYSVGMSRLIGAILLGIVTYDANLLVIERNTED